MNARVLLAALLAALVAGCAGFSPDGGFDAVQSAARTRLSKDVVWARDEAARDAARARVDALLDQPLSADDAVQVALLNNPGLQAAFNTLGIAEADRVAASRLPGLGFSISRLTQGSEVKWERSVDFSLMWLLTLPVRADIEQRLFDETRRALVLDTLRLASETRKAWVLAVAARQATGYRRQAMDAAEAGAELARRMAEVGNWSRLKQARQQAFYADAALALARADEAELQARERLVRLLGIDRAGRLKLPERLPDLPASLPQRPAVEQQAMDTRLDLEVARLQTEALAKHLGLTRRTRVINVLEFGVVNNSSNEAPQERGYEVRFELPLFDWGETRVARAEARYRQALEQARQLAVAARSEVREAYALQQGRYAVARHLRDEVVPLRQRISEETLLRYNGMLVGTFELLADAGSQIAAVSAAIDAQRDFWLADADLEMALAGTPGKTTVSSIAPAPSAMADGH